jgi:hypothetical protein
MCLYEDDRRRINATEMDALRRSARISKLERKTNECIRNKLTRKVRYWMRLPENNSFGMVMSREWTKRDYQKS